MFRNVYSGCGGWWWSHKKPAIAGEEEKGARSVVYSLSNRFLKWRQFEADDQTRTSIAHVILDRTRMILMTNLD